MFPVVSVSCEVSAWGSWAPCDQACGGGSRERTREVIRKPEGEGDKCPSLKESQSCNEQTCPGEGLPKTSRDCKRLPREHFLSCQSVKLLLPKDFLKLCHKLSFVKLRVFSFVRIWVFDLSLFKFSSLVIFWGFFKITFWVFEFCCHLSFWVVQIWVLEFRC